MVVATIVTAVIVVNGAIAGPGPAPGARPIAVVVGIGVGAVTAGGVSVFVLASAGPILRTANGPSEIDSSGRMTRV